MVEETRTLRDVVTRLEAANFDYMLTGSMALNFYTQPRMTRDIDIVIAFFLRDADRIEAVMGPEYYVSEAAAREAVLHQGIFNAVFQKNLVKVDFVIRKREEYRLAEFERRQRVTMEGIDLWIVSKEDLILSKLDWARESQSVRQIADVENLIVSGCDMEYLRAWSAKLNLTDMLTRVSP